MVRGGNVFVFAALDGDTITDFQQGVDNIDLRGTDAKFSNLTFIGYIDRIEVILQDGTLTLTGLDPATVLTVDDFLFGGT